MVYTWHRLWEHVEVFQAYLIIDYQPQQMPLYQWLHSEGTLYLHNTNPVGHQLEHLCRQVHEH